MNEVLVKVKWSDIGDETESAVACSKRCEVRPGLKNVVKWW